MLVHSKSLGHIVHSPACVLCTCHIAQHRKTSFQQPRDFMRFSCFATRITDTSAGSPFQPLRLRAIAIASPHNDSNRCLLWWFCVRYFCMTFRAPFSVSTIRSWYRWAWTKSHEATIYFFSVQIPVTVYRLSLPQLADNDKHMQPLQFYWKSRQCIYTCRPYTREVPSLERWHNGHTHFSAKFTFCSRCRSLTNVSTDTTFRMQPNWYNRHTANTDKSA